MSLKNRNETKLLMENWRKVLKEGLYDEDPELLEEGAKEAVLLAAAGLATFGALGDAYSKIPDESARDQKNATIGLIQQVQNIVNNSELEKDQKIESIEDIMNIIDKIKSPENQNLSGDQLEKYNLAKFSASKKIMKLKEKYFKLKKQIEELSINLEKDIEGINDATFQRGKAGTVQNKTGELGVLVEELSQVAKQIGSLIRIPEQIMIRNLELDKEIKLGPNTLFKHKISR